VVRKVKIRKTFRWCSF